MSHIDEPGENGPGHDDHHHHDNHMDNTSARVKALETLLVDKGLVDTASIDRIIETYETRVGPRNGAAVVAKAWRDESFAQWLKKDATAAIASLGFTGRQGEHMQVVFNTPQTHNVVVCTLCSCYPWSVLGLPPVWYKSPAYRSRVVIEPRAVLAEFGVELDEHKEVRVWDSTAELRYLVIPEPPSDHSSLDDSALAARVTRNSMIGTELL